MKKLCAMLCLWCPTSLAAPALRHTQGFQGWEVRAGTSAMSPLLAGAYSSYLTRTWYCKVGLSGQWRTSRGVRYQSLTLSPTLCWSCWQPWSNGYVNLLGAPLATYERHEEVGRRPPSSTPNLGFCLGGELELFLTDRLVLLLSLAPHYYFLSNPYGHWGYALSIGLKRSS